MGSNVNTHDLYAIWRGVKKRAGLNGNQLESYKRKGITMDPRWLDFHTFVADVGPRPTPLHTLDRVNNSLSYTPDNVKWATRMEQGNNREDNIVIDYHGECRTASEWARHVGVPVSTFLVRFNHIFTPPEPRNQRVVQKTKEGIMVKEFSNVADAETSSGVSQAAIRKCLCKHNKSAGGWIWEYLPE